MRDFEYISTIGEGAYGEVWKCRDRVSGKVVAVKGFKQAHEDTEILKLAVRETKMLESVAKDGHPNLVKLLSAFKSKTDRVYLVFEYVESSIHDELDRFPHGLPAAKTKMIAWQLLSAVSHLHDRKILHRDIKPTNILLSAESVVKLCDFGFARSVRCGPREIQQCTSYVTTRWYRAPEVLVRANYGPSADIWSVGCTIAELAAGRPIFPGESSADQVWRIMRCLGPFPPHLMARMAADRRLRSLATATPPIHKTLRQRLPELEPALFQVLEACLRPDPRQRPTARELMHMPYFWDAPRALAPPPAAALAAASVRALALTVAHPAAAAAADEAERQLVERAPIPQPAGHTHPQLRRPRQSAQGRGQGQLHARSLFTPASLPTNVEAGGPVSPPGAGPGGGAAQAAEGGARSRATVPALADGAAVGPHAQARAGTARSDGAAAAAPGRRDAAPRLLATEAAARQLGIELVLRSGGKPAAPEDHWRSGPLLGPVAVHTQRAATAGSDGTAVAAAAFLHGVETRGRRASTHCQLEVGSGGAQDVVATLPARAAAPPPPLGAGRPSQLDGRLLRTELLETDKLASASDALLTVTSTSATLSAPLFGDPWATRFASTMYSSPFHAAAAQSGRLTHLSQAGGLASGTSWEEVSTPHGAPALRPQLGCLLPHVRPPCTEPAEEDDEEGGGSFELNSRPSAVDWAPGSAASALGGACLLRAATADPEQGESRGLAAPAASARGFRSAGPSSFDELRSAKLLASGGSRVGRTLRSTAAWFSGILGGGGRGGAAGRAAAAAAGPQSAGAATRASAAAGPSGAGGGGGAAPVAVLGLAPIAISPVASAPRRLQRPQHRTADGSARTQRRGSSSGHGSDWQRPGAELPARRGTVPPAAVSPIPQPQQQQPGQQQPGQELSRHARLSRFASEPDSLLASAPQATTAPAAPALPVAAASEGLGGGAGPAAPRRSGRSRSATGELPAPPCTLADLQAAWRPAVALPLVGRTEPGYVSARTAAGGAGSASGAARSAVRDPQLSGTGSSSVLKSPDSRCSGCSVGRRSGLSGYALAGGVAASANGRPAPAVAAAASSGTAGGAVAAQAAVSVSCAEPSPAAVSGCLVFPALGRSQQAGTAAPAAPLLPPLNQPAPAPSSGAVLRLPLSATGQRATHASMLVGSGSGAAVAAGASKDAGDGRSAIARARALRKKARRVMKGLAWAVKSMLGKALPGRQE